MKNLFRYLFAVSLLVTVLATNAFAQPASLKEIMEQSGKHLRMVAGAVNAPEKNPEAAIASNEIRQLFVLAFRFDPDVLRNAPEDEKAALLRLYQKLVAQIVSVSANLEEAFLANDNATAKTLVADLARIRQEGHKVFNP
jgi:hypothetical protein